MEQKIIQLTAEHELSDIHVRANNALAIRVHGEIQQFPEEIISEEDIQKFLKTILTQKELTHFEETRDLDAAFVSVSYTHLTLPTKA